MMPDNNHPKLRPVCISIRMNRSDRCCLVWIVLFICGLSLLNLSPSTSPEQYDVDSLKFRLDLNSARFEELVLLPGIGESRATSIVRYRQKIGPFRTIDELVLIKGIGPKTLSGLASLVYVRPFTQPTTKREIVSASIPNGQVPRLVAMPVRLD